MTARTMLALGGVALLVLLFTLSGGGRSGAAVQVQAAEPGEAGQEVRFNRDIRPILSDACFNCHGFDAGSREADLRLDDEDNATADRGGYAVVVPGDAEASELYRRITTDEPADRMPPARADRQLDEQEIALIARWIEQGAAWEDHWSFVEPRAVNVPTAETEHHADWPRNGIDGFVLRTLEEEGLSPSPEADRRTLIRRLSFDLTGLPPTPEQVAKFVEDDRPDAYERLVERLLASPHYGERMAIYWLDLVRYADTVGYHGDQPVPVWPYRDYVIDAFNENMPFDQFTREQLAGDLLDDPTQRQRVAAGYNRLGMMSSEGGGQDEEYFARYAADRVRNASAVWMGTTLGCAECHDHKYDPFSIEDFYRFAAFFADIEEEGIYSRQDLPGGLLGWGEMMQVPQPEHEQELDRIGVELEQARDELDAEAAQLADARAEWEATVLAERPQWRVLEPRSAESAGGASMQVLEDDSVLAGGDRPETERYTVELAAPAGPVTAVRLEVLPHDSLPEQGPGRAGNGNLVLNGLTVEHVRADAEGTAVPLTDATVTHTQNNWSITQAIDGDHDRGSGWAILPEVGRAHEAVFETAEALELSEGDRLRVELIHNYPRHAIGRFRLAVTDAAQPPAAGERMGVPTEIAAIIETPAAERDEAQRDRLSGYYRSVAEELAPLRERIAELEQRREQVEQSIPWMVETVARDEPREVRVLPRGDWTDRSGEVVEPGVPHFLPQPAQAEGERLDRLDLADWLVSERNPLTARVFVNRLWGLFLGSGISGTLDDLGTRADWPSHPELLDWLAVQFVDSGWDVKHLVRLIVTSATYRQSSASDSHLDEVDPSNRLLARQSRFRIAAELLRDNALKISGLLEPTIGGRSVRPYQPAGYYAQLNFPRREYEQDTPPNLWRRGVYTHWQRQYVHPGMRVFDAPSREECTAERAQSNTPLQALVLLNDPIYVEAARVFAERILLEAEAEDVEGRIQFAFRQALSRAADDQELALLRELFDRHARQYEADAEAAAELADIGERLAAAELDAAEVAAWTSVARVILNLHETITRY